MADLTLAQRANRVEAAIQALGQVIAKCDEQLAAGVSPSQVNRILSVKTPAETQRSVLATIKVHLTSAGVQVDALDVDTISKLDAAAQRVDQLAVRNALIANLVDGAAGVINAARAIGNALNA